jgi:hypothetical protein
MKIATLTKPFAAFAMSAIAFAASAGVEVISVSPEQGDVSSLQTINIGFSSVVANSEGEMDYSFITVTDASNKSYSYTATCSMRTAVLSIALDEEITTNGTYTVTIPAQSLMSMSGETNDDAIVLKYNVTDEAGSGSASYSYTWGTPDPAPGKVKSIAKSISIPYTSSESISVYDCDSKGAKVTGPNGEIDYSRIAISSRSNTVSLYLNEEITAVGTYTITIPEGWVVNTDSKGISPELSFSYTIEEVLATPDFFATPDPEEEQTSISTIQLYMPEVNDFSLVAYETGDESLAYAIVEKDGVKVTQGLLEEGSMTFGRNTINTIDITLDQTIADAGTYTVTIPQGAVKDNESGDILGEFIMTYNVIGLATPNYTVNPDPETTLESLSGTIQVTYTDFTKVGFSNGPFTVAIKDAEGETVCTTEASLPGFKNIVQLEILDDEVITKAGVYTLSIPAGAVYGLAASEDDEDTMLGAVNLSYYVGKDFVASIDPAEGVVESLSEFTITFDGATKVKASDDAGPSDYPYYATVSADGTITKVKQMLAYAYGTSNSITLRISGGEITDAGSYAIVVPAAYYTIDGIQPKEDLKFYYTIESKATKFFCDYKFINIEEDETVSSLDNIEFEFVAVDENWEPITEGITYKHDVTMAPTLGRLNDSGSAVVEYNNGTITGTDPHLIWSSYYGVETNGMYLFTIPEGYMTLTDASGNVVKSDEVMAMFFLEKATDGVNSIKVEIVKDNAIYNLNGVKMNVEASKLPAGIYIVNGRKVVLK